MVTTWHKLVKSVFELRDPPSQSLSWFLWRLTVLLLPSGWDVSPTQGNLPTFRQAFLIICRYPYRTRTRTVPLSWVGALWEQNVFPKNSTKWPGQFSNQNFSTKSPATITQNEVLKQNMEMHQINTWPFDFFIQIKSTGRLVVLKNAVSVMHSCVWLVVLHRASRHSLSVVFLFPFETIF